MKKINIFRAAIATLGAIALLFTAGCGGQNGNAGTNSGDGENTNPPTQTVNITITGSDSMLHLCNNWAEQFMKNNKNYMITVNGGGSGVGIKALINGTTDIASASREMKGSEKDEAKTNGNEAVENLVALDGIAIAINPENPVQDFTMTQLKDIFTGKKTSWKDFGGPDQKIIILSRESSSGTYQFFQEHVLAKENYAQTALLMPATSAIIDSVAQDKWAIGYVGLGYAAEAGSRIKVVPVKKDDASPAVMPSEATVKDKSYPIARALYLYTKTTSTSDVTKFIDFVLSPDGQNIVKEAGYITK